MLIIPVSDSIQRRFPWATVLLIFLNICIFVYFQQGEQQKYIQAVSWARSSGLLDIEVQVYQEYLQHHHEKFLDIPHDNGKSTAVFERLLQDDRFQSALRQQILIPPADPRFADWAAKRKIFEEKLAQSLAYRLGYSPARRNYLGIIGYMLFHDQLIPLIGNMLFLWFVGSWLEIGIGRILFLGTYLVTGACSALTLGFIQPMHQGPLLGASGAIAGLMGTYLLLYCDKRNKALCSLGFCSRQTSIFGWFLFPFWVSKEVYFVANFPKAQTVTVHIAAVFAGLIIGLLVRIYQKKEHKKTAEAGKIASSSTSLLPEQQNLHILNNLSEKETATLRKKIQETLKNNPDNLTELVRLFYLEKEQPKSEQFHKTAGKLLRHLAATGSQQELYTYFQEYKQFSGAPRLPPSVLLALAQVHIRSGKTSQAARFLLLLMKQRPQYPGLPSCLFTLACAYREQGKEERAEKCFQLICRQYPQTLISQQAEEMLTPPYSITVQ